MKKLFAILVLSSSALLRAESPLPDPYSPKVPKLTQTPIPTCPGCDKGK